MVTSGDTCLSIATNADSKATMELLMQKITQALTQIHCTNDWQNSPNIVVNQSKIKRFEALVLPHLDAAYNLARWLTRNDQDAQDIAQEASLRAFKFLDGFHGEKARAWLLTIVRNVYLTWLHKTREREFDE